MLLSYMSHVTVVDVPCDCLICAMFDGRRGAEGDDIRAEDVIHATVKVAYHM